MTNEQLKVTLEAINRTFDEIGDSEEKAQAFLVEAGIVTPTGELTAPYRADA